VADDLRFARNNRAIVNSAHSVTGEGTVPLPDYRAYVRSRLFQAIPEKIGESNANAKRSTRSAIIGNADNRRERYVFRFRLQLGKCSSAVPRADDFHP
jgi:hypothetical protein